MQTLESFRKIIHADMDAFYASVEIRENPSLQGKPVVVGGSPESRGVVCAASYEARKYGIRSAIPCSQAKRLCPDAVFVYPNFSLYKQVSEQIHSIFREYTDLVEPLSLDEAYMDVTRNKKDIPYATTIAEEIKMKVKSTTELTISCGVSYNKFLAKIASDWRKPDGLYIIRPGDAENFLDALPIGKFYGVGKVTEVKMNQLGIFYGRDLKARTQLELEKHFGKMGQFFYQIVRGIDNRSVVESRERKSLGIEDTFPSDTNDRSELTVYLRKLSEGLWRRMESKGIRGKSLTMKLKFSDFRLKSVTETYPRYLEEENEIRDVAFELFDRAWQGEEKIRLLGLSLSNLEKEEEDDQPRLFS